MVLYLKKSLKIQKEQSKSEKRRRTDNTMAKRKRTKGQTIIYKTQHRKLKIPQKYSEIFTARFQRQCRARELLESIIHAVLLHYNYVVQITNSKSSVLR